MLVGARCAFGIFPVSLHGIFKETFDDLLSWYFSLNGPQINWNGNPKGKNSVAADSSDAIRGLGKNFQQFNE